MASKKHVHCWDVWPGGAIRHCVMTPLELDGELLHKGVRYKPVLVFDARNCLVIERDFVGAFVVTPADGIGSPIEDRAGELVGTGVR